MHIPLQKDTRYSTVLFMLNSSPTVPKMPDDRGNISLTKAYFRKSKWVNVKELVFLTLPMLGLLSSKEQGRKDF